MSATLLLVTVLTALYLAVRAACSNTETLYMNDVIIAGEPVGYRRITFTIPTPEAMLKTDDVAPTYVKKLVILALRPFLELERLATGHCATIRFKSTTANHSELHTIHRRPQIQGDGSLAPWEKPLSSPELLLPGTVES